MKKWNNLPELIKNESIKPYYLILKKKWFYRFLKRTFDILMSIILLMILFLPSFIIGVIICCESKGGPFFVQTRIGKNYKPFKIYKFRSMKSASEGDDHITHKNDMRITKVGKFIRKTHIDEFPQLINVFIGDMSFVGTRPEVPFYVKQYKDEWKATLLMRPGITSTASYTYQNEAKDIEQEKSNDIYVSNILPKKMKENLNDILRASVAKDIAIMLKTIF